MKWLAVLLGLVVVVVSVWFWIKPEKPETPYADALVDALDRAKNEQVRGSFQTIHTGLAAYTTQEGAYPTVNDVQALAPLVSPHYIARIHPIDPWGRPYRYTSNGSSYELRCAGQDGTFGNGDDVVMQDGAIFMPKGFRNVELRP